MDENDLAGSDDTDPMIEACALRTCVEAILLLLDEARPGFLTETHTALDFFRDVIGDEVLVENELAAITRRQAAIRAKGIVDEVIRLNRRQTH